MFPLRDSMQRSVSVWCTAIIAIFAAVTSKLYQIKRLIKWNSFAQLVLKNMQKPCRELQTYTCRHNVFAVTFFFEKKYVAISRRAGAHVGERILLLSAICRSYRQKRAVCVRILTRTGTSVLIRVPARTPLVSTARALRSARRRA